MRAPTEAAIAAEADALDKIHAVLDLPKNHRGLLVGEIAKQTGLAIGRVKEILEGSVTALRRRPRHPNLWFNDWSQLEGYHRPEAKRDPRGRRKLETITLCPHCLKEISVPGFKPTGKPVRSLPSPIHLVDTGSNPSRNGSSSTTRTS